MATEAESTSLLKEAVDVCDNELNAFLQHREPYPSGGNMSPLRVAIVEHPKLGKDYYSEVGHDLMKIINFAEAALLKGEINEGGLRACAKGRLRMINSVLEELDFTPQQFDLRQSVDEQVDFFSRFSEWRQIHHPGQSTVIFSTLLKDYPVTAQMDVVYRMLFNATYNSLNSIADKATGYPYEGKIRFDAQRSKDGTVLRVVDNGKGFGHTFGIVGLDTNEPQVPVSEFLNRSGGFSGFREAGLDGNGIGLMVIQHLSQLTGVEAAIANPKFVAGSEMLFKFPN